MGRIARRDHPEPPCRFVEFDATDGVELFGLLFEPKRKTTRAAIFLHGTGGASIFDSRRTNLMADEFVQNGIAYFPFNNRGAHLIKRLRKRGIRRRNVAGGMAHERIRDAVYDIDGAIRELRKRGYRDFTLIGHSTGANKIAVYDHYRRRNPVKRYVFLGGGDDVGLNYKSLGRRMFRRTLKEAAKKRNSDELMPITVAEMPMSWRAFFDMSNPDGDYNVFPFLEAMRRVRLSKRPLFRYLRAVKKPSLVIYGDRDEYCFGDVSRCVSLLAEKVARPNFEFVIMKDADHGFGRRERDVVRLIVSWLNGAA